MDSIRKLGPRDTAWLAATLTIISAGGAALVWEWHYAHVARHKHGKAAAHHQQHLPGSGSEITPSESH